MTRIFTGDFSTGNFSQWPYVNNRDSGPAPTGILWRGRSYPAKIVSVDKDCGFAARFEVRSGDKPDYDIGQPKERSEVSIGPENTASTVLNGQTAWWAFSVLFDETFPLNQHALGWGAVCQWHGISSPYSPALQLGWRTPNPIFGLVDGYWYLLQNRRNPNGSSAGADLLAALPLSRGEWQDIRMRIRVSNSLSTSPSDPNAGLIELWRNGIRQTLLGGVETYYGQTSLPDDPGVKNQIGLYRAEIDPTGILYHTGFRIADSESSL